MDSFWILFIKIDFTIKHCIVHCIKQRRWNKTFSHILWQLFQLSGDITKPEDFEKFMMSNGHGVYSCSLCSYTNSRTTVRRHVESIHFPNTLTYTCPLCLKTFGTICCSQESFTQINFINLCLCFLYFLLSCLSGDLTKPEDFENYMMSNGVGSFTCSLCSYTKSRTLVRLHVESIHFPNTFTYYCPDPACQKTFGTNKAFIIHKNRAHKWWNHILVVWFWIILELNKEMFIKLPLFDMVLIQVEWQNRKILTNTWWVTEPEATPAVFVHIPRPGPWSGITWNPSTFQTRSPTSVTSVARCLEPITHSSCIKNDSTQNQTLLYFPNMFSVWLEFEM